MRSHSELYSVAAASSVAVGVALGATERFGFVVGLPLAVAAAAVAYRVTPGVLWSLLVLVFPLRATGDDGVELRGLAAKRRLLAEVFSRQPSR